MNTTNNGYIAGVLAQQHRLAAKARSVGCFRRVLLGYDEAKKEEAAERAHLKTATAYDGLRYPLLACAYHDDDNGCESLSATLQQLIDCDRLRERDRASWQEKRCWRLVANIINGD